MFLFMIKKLKMFVRRRLKGLNIPGSGSKLAFVGLLHQPPPAAHSTLPHQIYQGHTTMPLKCQQRGEERTGWGQET